MSTRQSDFGSKEMDLSKFIIVRLSKGNKSYELLADPDEAWKQKQVLRELNDELAKKHKDAAEVPKLTTEMILKDNRISVMKIFEGTDVFYDIRKGERVPAAEIEEVFGTTNLQQIQAQFLLEGDFNWSKKQREEVQAKKIKKIVEILAQNSINPQTRKPHPAARIEKAMEQAKVKIDLVKLPEDQVDDVVKKISRIIPIKLEQVELILKIPAQYSGKTYNVVERYANIRKSEWQNDGSWLGMLSMPAGLQTELITKISKITKGRAVIEKKR